MQYGQKAKEIRKAYEQNEAVPELAAQIRKSKAFDWLLHNIEFVDANGDPIDRDTLLGHSHDDDGGELDQHEHSDDQVDVKSAAAAVIAATDAAATDAAATDAAAAATAATADDDLSDEESNEATGEQPSEEETT